MPNTYAVEIHYEAPYPASKSYNVVAGNFGMAVNRAFSKFKKEKVTTKRQTSVSFKVHNLGRVISDENI